MIEKNVPMLDAARGRRKYEWAAMNAGDSFFIGCADEREVMARRKAVLSSAYHANIKVSTRKVPGGFRVWRVE